MSDNSEIRVLYPPDHTVGHAARFNADLTQEPTIVVGTQGSGALANAKKLGRLLGYRVVFNFWCSSSEIPRGVLAVCEPNFDWAARSRDVKVIDFAEIKDQLAEAA